MNRLGLYRALIRLLPKPTVDFRAVKQRLPDESLQRFRAVLRRHRARDGALAFFDQDGISDFVVYGEARRGVKVWADTPFRLASVSKLVTAAGILAMAQKGLLDLDADADTGLPYSLRHPQAKERPVTLRMLLTHTAGIRDGAAYTRGLTDGSDAAGYKPCFGPAGLKCSCCLSQRPGLWRTPAYRRRAGDAPARRPLMPAGMRRTRCATTCWRTAAAAWMF